MKIDVSILAPKCLICTKAMTHVFPDATRDGMAQVFKCANCQIVETITEMRGAPALERAS
jgi:transposase-like protein